MIQNSGFRLIGALSGLLLVNACVDHRPVRNGLRDESVYLEKTALTAPNPKIEDSTDDGWYFKTTVVKTSAPNVLSEFIFPGLESDLRYVRFRYQEDALQVLDARTLQLDDPANPNDDLATQTERVLLQFAGGHVDVKLRESLDGERTNFLEENTELPWRQRQHFKVDFEKTSMEPASQLLWAYGLYASLCAIPKAAHLVPDSFEWDAEDQYLSFVIDVTYQVNWNGWICNDLLHLYEWNAFTSNVQYRFAFYRPGETGFQPEPIEEKAEVNKRYGVFQTYNIFRDPESGLIGSANFVNRWDPNRETPATFYFHKGFPEKFKPMFGEIAAATNQVFAEAGSKLRVCFVDWYQEGVQYPSEDELDCPRPAKEPKFGDPRYSFAVWHEGIDQTLGLLGYGPSSAVPQTGEIISANLNLYNVGLDRYRYYIENYLDEHGGLLKPDADKAWEDIECAEGATVAPGDPVRCKLVARDARAECEAAGAGECAMVESQAEQECRQSPRLTTHLFNEMRRVMEREAGADGSADDFIPRPQRAGFRDDLHKIVHELRYAYPPWNRYVYRGTEFPAEQLVALEEKEHAFQDAMHAIMMGENPYGATALYTRDGIQKQLDFAENMRDWRKAHAERQALRDHLFATKNIYTFDPHDAINSIAMAGRRCVPRDGGKHTWESDDEYRERIIEAVVFKVAIHEFGHNLSLRHNFYGSVDAKHMRPGDNSASVMDYVSSWEEAGTLRDWGRYDQLALTWIYGSEDKRKDAIENPKNDVLYCTDEHRILSPLCSAHDLGITPAQIVLNSIERYDWLYNIRNRRAYRTFWDTGSYVGGVYDAVFSIQRMWYLALFDWGSTGTGAAGTLKRLHQVGGEPVLTDPEYDEIAADFGNEIQAAVGMTIAFYDAVINQPSSFRNYQTEFDPFYGDILRLGIIIDKLFTTYAFMDLTDIYYSPNVATYAALWDNPVGSRNFALAQRVLDNMLGSNYDTFPWFRYTAVGLFASATNSNLVGNIQAKERFAIERYENEMELFERYPEPVIELARRSDNPQQTFVHGGEEYVYTYLEDRSWHLVARKSRSPVSYQFIRDYNETLRENRSGTLDNYGLKILLAYHEYFNNFVGF